MKLVKIINFYLCWVTYACDVIIGWLPHEMDLPHPLPPNQHCAPTNATPPMHGAASPLAKCTDRPHLRCTQLNYMILLL